MNSVKQLSQTASNFNSLLDQKKDAHLEPVTQFYRIPQDKANPISLIPLAAWPQSPPWDVTRLWWVGAPAHLGYFPQRWRCHALHLFSHLRSARTRPAPCPGWRPRLGSNSPWVRKLHPADGRVNLGMGATRQKQSRSRSLIVFFLSNLRAQTSTQYGTFVSHILDAFVRRLQLLSFTLLDKVALYPST